MKGDFSRISFDAKNHFSRVLTQQGRVTLDADFNEQSDILLHTLRTLARDLFGPFGGPVASGGFGLILGPPNDPNTPDLTIGGGHYYVDGILCESDGCDYAHQPDYVPAGGDPLLTWLKRPSGGDFFWIYLDVWERHITWIEQDSIREVALGAGGPDTCTRSKVVWQVKAISVLALIDILKKKKHAVDAMTQTNDAKALSAKLQRDMALLDERKGACEAPLAALTPISDATMAARLDPEELQIKDPCTISPDAKYRGAENQLYRIEVHQGNVDDPAPPTFKWSRDNGSVATRWLGTEGNDLIVANARGFAAGCWVELSDDGLDLNGKPGHLVKLTSVQSDRLSVDPGAGSIAWTAQLDNPKVRRWDQSENDNTTLVDGAIPIVESSAQNPTWIDLEDGIQVRFASGGGYRSGDYWLIPARVATGSIEWESDAQGDSLLKAPQGVKHHYAPLGFIGLREGRAHFDDCRVCRETSPGNCPSAAVIVTPAGPPAPRPVIRPVAPTRAN